MDHPRRIGQWRRMPPDMPSEADVSTARDALSRYDAGDVQGWIDRLTGAHRDSLHKLRDFLGSAQI